MGLMMRPEMKLILLELNNIKMLQDDLTEINFFTEEMILASRIGQKQVISCFAISDSKELLAIG